MFPMGKRRRRDRARRFVPRPGPSRSTSTLEDVARPSREVVRPRVARSVGARATGQPSNALAKAATAEYGYVVRDLRRIGVVGVAVLALLALATFAANTFLK